MDFNTVWDMVVNQGVWCALFVYFFITSKTESAKREDKLMGVIDAQGTKLSEITMTLNNINTRLGCVESKIDVK